MLTNIGVIGVGAIAEAVVDGLATAAPHLTVHLSPRNAETAARLAAAHPTASVCPDNQAVVDRSEVLLLCVRPDDTGTVLDEIDVPRDVVVISAVAGWSVGALLRQLPNQPDITRVIPLPAVRQLRGTTAVYPGHPAVDEVFGQLGATIHQ